MSSQARIFFLAVVLAFLSQSEIAVARSEAGFDLSGIAPTAITPAVAEHNVGAFSFGISNDGVLAAGNYTAVQDIFTGQYLDGCHYPIGSRTQYTFWGGIWIGGVVGVDTLISTSVEGWAGGNEFRPVGNVPPIAYHSTTSTNPLNRQNAVSHQDYVAWYADTCTDCRSIPRDENRYHIPLGLVVRQSSYNWSYLHASDFVIVVLDFFHIGTQPISQGYLGLYFDNDVYGIGTQEGYSDDLTGFSQFHPDPNGCGVDTIPVAWLADNDGDLYNRPPLSPLPVPNVTAAVPIDVSQSGPVSSFNWWISNGDPNRDFGPRMIGRPVDPYRDFGTGGEGTPVRDVNKYYVMRHREFDYDMAYVASVDPFDSIWAYPRDRVPILDYANGYDARYLISCGPFDLLPGDSMRFVFAYVGGRNFHVDPTNLENLPLDPWTYTSNLNFDDLARNARMSRWVYDNPGFDTDGDGYAGKFRVCDGDTAWYEGDGVPDLVADVPPSAPSVAAFSSGTDLIVQWNGTESEMSIDRVSGAADFEGYNVYLRFDSSADSLVKVAQWDAEDYFRYYWEQGQRTWECDRRVYSAEQLRARYAPDGETDSIWFPLAYTRISPMATADSFMYFLPVGCNVSRFGKETPITKRYPDAPRPPYRRTDDVPADSTDRYLDPEGDFKFYDYELVIHDVAPGIAYDLAVAAFDRGSPMGALSMLESARISVQVVVPELGECCIGRVGNVDCDAGATCDIGDLTALIDHLFLSNGALCCSEAANVDGSTDGAVDIADLSALVESLFISYTQLRNCGSTEEAKAE